VRFAVGDNSALLNKKRNGKEKESKKESVKETKIVSSRFLF